MVGDRLAGGSVVRGFNETQEKHVSSGGLFSSSIFIFFYIDDKGKINLIARSSHSNL